MSVAPKHSNRNQSSISSKIEKVEEFKHNLGHHMEKEPKIIFYSEAESA